MPEPKKLSVTDFAALIRSETGAFQDIPDAKLVEQFVERFPAYRSVVDMSATEALARAEVPAEPEGVSRLVTLAGAAFNRGLASPITTLIDLASKVTDPISKAIGLPEAELLGGSQQVERLISENIGQATPRTPAEQVLSTLGQEAGATVGPGAGILKAAGWAATRIPAAAQGIRGLLGETSRQIAGAPGRALATEAGAAVGAGAGRAGVEQLAPESPTLQTLGALGGGLTGGIGTGLGVGLGRPRRPLQGPPAAFEREIADEAFTTVPPRPPREPEIPEFPIYTRPDSAARLAAEKEQFGSIVPRRIFGAEPERFPTLPRRLAQAEEARVTLETTRRQEVYDAAIQAGKTPRQAQNAAKKIQVSILPLTDEQFAIEARIAAEQHDDTVRALRSQRGIDPAKVEAERLKDITPEPVARPKDIDVERLLAAPEAPPAPAGTPQALTQQVRAARAATSPVLPGELPPSGIPMERILPLVEQAGVNPEHFAGVMQRRFGRTHFNTPDEFREMAGALKNISRKPVVIDPDILEASPYWDVIEPIERVQLAARGAVRQLLGTGLIRIAKMGPLGRQLAQMIDDVEVVSGIRSGKANDMVDKFKRGFGKNPQAKENFRQALHKGLPSEGDVADGVSRTQAQLDQIYDEAALLDLKERSSTGALKPIQRRSPYLPNFVKIDVFRTAAAQRRFVKDMEKVLAGEGVPAEDIKNRINSYLLSRHPKVAIDPHLERGRELNVPDKWLETDPFKILTLYFSKAFRRLEQARIFGPNNEKGFELISQIENPADRQFALDLFRRWAGVHEESRDLNLIVEWMRGYQSATKLSFGTTLLNIWQPVVQGAIRTNVKSVFRGFKDILGEARRESRSLAIRAGSVQDDVIHEAAQAAGGGGRISSWLVRNVYLFNGSEINNRFWGSAIGKHYSRDMAAKLIKNPANTVARRELRRFNVDPDEVLANRALTEDDILLAAQRGSEDINYRFRPQDNPAFANHPIGKLWFQFRNFSLNTAKLITRELGQQTLRALDNKEEAARAMAQWAKFVSLSPFVGMAQVISSKTLRRVGMALVFGKVVLSPEEQQVASLAIEWALATSTGIYYDALSSMRYGEHGVMGLLGGATFSTAVEAPVAVKRGPEATARFIAKQIPQIGKFVPPARRGREATGIGGLKGIR